MEKYYVILLIMTDLILCPVPIENHTFQLSPAKTQTLFKELSSIQRPATPCPCQCNTPVIIRSNPIPIPVRKSLDPSFESYDEWGLIDRCDLDRVDDTLTTHIISYYNQRLPLSKSDNSNTPIQLNWIKTNSYS